MGTNYYAIVDTCEHCGRADPPVHIGKLSSGLRGYSPTDSPTSYPLGSWSQWLHFLTHTTGLTVQSDEGETLTVEELVDRFQAVPVERRRAQFDWVEQHPGMIGNQPSDTTLDEESGWTITWREFS